MHIGKVIHSYRNVNRLRVIINVLFKHGLGFIITKLDLGKYIPFTKRYRYNRIPSEELPVRLRLVCEDLGPTFIKFGQMLGTRPDLIPQEYIKEFEKLQENIPPCSYEEVRKQIKNQTGKTVENIFASFDPQPIGSASVAQVHAAKITEGEQVVVKIQRPRIADVIAADLDILYFIAQLIEKKIEEMKLYRPVNLIQEFDRALNKELDFTHESRNIKKIMRNFKDDTTVHIPKVYTELTTKKMLTIEKINGIQISNIAVIEAQGMERTEIAKHAVAAVFKQIFEHGFFHADPHPGNVYVLEDNVICFLDFGLMGYVDEELKTELSDIFLGIIKKEPNKIIRTFIKKKIINEHIEIRRLTHDMSDLIDKYYDQPLGNIQIGSLFQEMTGLIHQYRIYTPAEYVLLARALIGVEAMVRQLDPEINVVKYVEPYAKKLILQKYAPARIIEEGGILVGKIMHLIKNFPDDTMYILNKIKEGKLHVEFEHKGLEKLIKTLGTVSSQISISLIIAALMIGSSLIIQTNRGILLFGYPLIGIIGYSIAAVISVFLFISIIRTHNK